MIDGGTPIQLNNCQSMERNCLSDHVPPKTSCKLDGRIRVPRMIWEYFIQRSWKFQSLCEEVLCAHILLLRSAVVLICHGLLCSVIWEFDGRADDRALLSSNIKSSTGGAQTFPQAPTTFIHIVYPQSATHSPLTRTDQSPKPFFIIYINSIRNGALGQFFHWK